MIDITAIKFVTGRTSAWLRVPDVRVRAANASYIATGPLLSAPQRHDSLQSATQCHANSRAAQGLPGLEDRMFDTVLVCLRPWLLSSNKGLLYRTFLCVFTSVHYVCLCT